MKKKCSSIISLLICLALILPAPVFAGQSTADYSGHWAGTQIKSFLDMGFIALSKDGNFKPDQPVTRAEFAAIANKAFALIEKDVTGFKDIQARDESYKDLLIAKKAGYLAGLPDGTVNPKGYMSRQEYAVIISRLLKLDATQYIGEADKYADASAIPAWSKGAIGAAAKFGYMQGEPGGIFNPKGFVTRGQAVVVLERCYLASVKVAYNKSGTYSAGVIEGNAAINAPGVTLENTTINGNLIIGEGVGNGNAKLKNVIVKGDTIVKGGGPNSIIIEDSQLKNIIIIKEDNKIRIVAVGKTTVERVDMQSGGKLEEQDATGSGFGYVTIAEGLDSNEPVILKGSFETVQVLAAGVKLNVEAGSIARLDVAKTAEGAKLNLGTGVKVTELVVQAKAEVTGSGTISKAKVEVQGVVITAPTATITAAAGVTVATTTPGQSPAPAPSTPTSGNTGGGGGSGSGGGSRDDDRNTTIAVSGVTLNHTTMTLTVGEAAGTLTATVAPANATDKRVTWTSSNTNIATVANGVVTPVAAGTATVTVKTVSGAKTAACLVTVKEREPDTLAVTYTQFEEAGQHIAVTAKYYHNTTVSEAVYTDTRILSDKDVTFVLKSKPVAASTWGNPEILSLTAGKSESLAELLAENAESDISYEKLKDMEATDFAIEFTHISGEPVEEYVGIVNITFKALAGDLYEEYEAAEVIGTGAARAEFNIAPVAVTGVFLNQKTLTLTAGGEAKTLTATVEPDDAANKNVTWSSDNKAVATVADGVVTPVAKGTAVITVTTVDGGKTASCTVKVIGEDEEPEIDYLPYFIGTFIENTSNLSFTVAGKLTGPIDTGKLRYITSENGQYGHTLSGSYELVSSSSILEPGQYMHYSFGSYSSVYIYLTDADANGIIGLQGYGNNASITNAETDRLVAEGGWYPNAGTGVKPVEISKEINVVNDSPVTINGIYYFDKDDKLIGSRSVNEGYMGNVRISLQTTNIVFYSGTYDPEGKPTSGKMKTVPFDPEATDGITLDAYGWIDVDATNFGPTAPGSNPEAVTGVTLNRNTLGLTEGGPAGTLIATVEPAGAANKNVTWSSDNEAVATVDNGIVTPVGAGTAIITVTTVDGGKTASCEVSVSVNAVNFLPPYQAELTANINMLTFRAGGLLTEEIDLSKIKYVTSRSGEYHYNLLGAYSRVEPHQMAPGRYWYLKNFDQTMIYLELTENDADAIKALTGYGSDLDNLYDSIDSLVAEEDWYPDAETGTKGVYINNEISITNDTDKKISGIYQYADNGVMFEALQLSLNPGQTGRARIREWASNIIFYIGDFTHNEPTSGKMKLVPVNEELITNGITLDGDGWIDVNEINFGPGAF